MERTEYRSLLGQLPIKSPTPGDMARMCSHLTKEQAVKAFTNGRGYVACPPLRVRNGFQVIAYHQEWVEEIKVWGIINGEETQVITGTKNHPARLSWEYAGRTRASYADGQSHGDIFIEYPHMQEAMKFAEANWDAYLTLDDWVDMVEFIIQDPTDLVNDRYHKDQPRTKAVLNVALSRELNKIINDRSKPESELFNEAIAEITDDRLISSEIKGGRGGYMEFNCAHCGGGLALSYCTSCGHKFHDDQFRCGWHTPLSKRMVDYLRKNGHKFKIDPLRAQLKEKKSWEERKSR